MKSDTITRRHALLLSLSAFSYALAGGAVPALSAQSVAHPTDAMVLTRKLVRHLSDGNAIIVTRSWRLDFTVQARGIAVNGKQVSVKVEAPPVLARFVEIEEARTTDGMFPLLLAEDGTIMAAGNQSDKNDVQSAIDAALALFRERGLSAANARTQGQIMTQMQSAGSSALEQLPGDLFYPSTTPFSEVRTVALPEGAQGEFEVNWTASVHDGTSLLKTARREIITRIGDSERRSIEEWSLAAA